MSNNNVKYDNMFNMGCASTFKECLNEQILDMINLKKLKYFHTLDEEYININCDMAYKNLFKIDNENNELIQNAPLFSNINITLSIYDCDLCGECIIYEIELNTRTIFGYCSYYENAAKIIQKKIRQKRRLKVLWKIAEYYTKQKYSPKNIMKYIKLE